MRRRSSLALPLATILFFGFRSATAQAQGSIAEIIPLVSSAGDAAEKLAKGLSALGSAGLAGWDEIKLRRFQSSLIDLSRSLTKLQGGQVNNLIPALKDYAKNPSPQAWRNAMTQASGTLTQVTGLLDTLNKEQSELVLQPAYVALTATLGTRSPILGRMLNLPAPTAKLDLADLDILIGRYERLSEQLAVARDSLNAYALRVKKGASSPKP